MGDPYGEISYEPVVCGEQGRPQIHLDGETEPDLAYPYVSWEDLHDILYTVLTFYEDFKEAGRRWGPTVSFRGERYEDYDPEHYESLTIDWFGRPRNA